MAPAYDGAMSSGRPDPSPQAPAPESAASAPGRVGGEAPTQTELRVARSGGVLHLRGLLDVARGRMRPLIHLQHNPDPDALASAETLRFLFHRLLGVDAVLAYTGRISRAENRAMCRHLGIRARPAYHVRYEDHDLVVVVDTHPGSGTCKLPEGVVPDIVVDHHPPRDDLSHIPYLFSDVTFGSTSTMVGALLVENGIPYDARLATALTYGIRTDTADLARNVGEHDERIYREVYARADKQVLARIVGARVAQDYFVVLERGLRNGTVTDHTVTSWLGNIEHSDSVAEIADLLLRLEGVRWVMAAGQTADTISASIRAFRATQPTAGDVAHEISGGHGGGHDTFAALQMPFEGTPKQAQEAYAALCDRLLEAVGAKRSLRRSLAGDEEGSVATQPARKAAAKGKARAKRNAGKKKRAKRALRRGGTRPSLEAPPEA